MKPSVAAKIVALRPAMEALMNRYANEPQAVEHSSENNPELMDAVKVISNIDAGRYRHEDEHL